VKWRLSFLASRDLNLFFSSALLQIPKRSSPAHPRLVERGERDSLVVAVHRFKSSCASGNAPAVRLYLVQPQLRRIRQPRRLKRQRRRAPEFLATTFEITP